METTSNSVPFTQTEQSLSQDLSLKQISQIILKNWLLFFVLLVVLASLAVSFYAFKTPYVAEASVNINDAQNSSLQSFTTQYYGLSKLVNEGKKSNSPLQKHSEYLKTSDFFEKFLAEIQNSDSSGLTLAERQGQLEFKNQFLNGVNLASAGDEEKKLKAMSFLDGSSRIKLTSDFEIKISFVAESKELALYLTNAAVRSTLKILKQKELDELGKVEGFIKEQIETAEKNMSHYNRQLAEFQNKTENLISLSSKEKVGDYLSELMVRKNEIKMKMASNQKMIAYLSQGSKNVRESQLYGNGGRVQSLKIENEMFENQLVQIQASVDRVASVAKTIPVASQVFDELKAKSDLEFQKYKGLSENLSKAEAQKLSIESRFEISETARMDRVKPQVSLMILLLVAVVLSQLIGSLIIYVSYIWDSNTVTAQSSRNIVIIDGHNLDPRIVVENSKIRFRLKHSNFAESNELEEDFGSKKLTFRLFNKRSANGDESDSM